MQSTKMTMPASFRGRCSLLYPPAIDQFEVPKIRRRAGWIDRCDNRPAIRVRVVQVQRQRGGELIVRADIGNRGQSVVQVGRTSRISEREVVVGSAAAVPEIGVRCQLQEVQIGADLQLLAGVVDYLDELIAAIHRVVEREPGVHSRRRKNLKEGCVLRTGCVGVAGATEESSAEPRLRDNTGQPISAFDSRCTGVLIEQPPVPILQDPPEQKIETPRTCWDGRHGIGAVGADADVLMVGPAYGERTVVRLGESGAAVVIVDRKDTPKEMLVKVLLTVCEVLQINIQLRVGTHCR